MESIDRLFPFRERRRTGFVRNIVDKRYRILAPTSWPIEGKLKIKKRCLADLIRIYPWWWKRANRILALQPLRQVDRYAPLAGASACDSFVPTTDRSDFAKRFVSGENGGGRMRSIRARGKKKGGCVVMDRDKIRTGGGGGGGRIYFPPFVEDEYRSLV